MRTKMPVSSRDFHCLNNLGPGAFQWHLEKALVPKYYTYLNSSVKLDTLKLAPIHMKIYLFYKKILCIFFISLRIHSITVSIYPSLWEASIYWLCYHFSCNLNLHINKQQTATGISEILQLAPVNLYIWLALVKLNGFLKLWIFAIIVIYSGRQKIL